MIEVRYKARLGNNLFQYAMGRILAEELGYELFAKPIPGFPGTRERVGGVSHVDAPEQVLTGQRVDLRGIFEDRSPRRIVLDGWFQRHEYYHPYRERIRRWLRFDSSIAGLPEPPGTVLIVRRTDYVALKWALPFSFYQEALERLAPIDEPLWIATDDPADPFFLRFKRPLRFFKGTALEQLKMLSQARRLVLSQSTFSWWPTFLGDPETVICPLPSHGVWSGTGEHPEVDLIERDRFICLPCPTPYEPSRSEASHQRDLWWRWRIITGLNRRFHLGLHEPSI